MCDWIEAHGERYEGFVEDEGEESDAGRGKRRGRGGKEKEGGKESAQGGPSKRLQAYLRGMRENGECGSVLCLGVFGVCGVCVVLGMGWVGLGWGWFGVSVVRRRSCCWSCVVGWGVHLCAADFWDHICADMCLISV